MGWMLAATGACLAGWIAVGFALARAAERKISATPLRSPWRSVVCAAALAGIALAIRPLPQAAVVAIVCIALVAASGTDYRTGYLVDAVTLPTALLALLLALVTHTTAMASLGVASLVIPFGGIVLFSRGRLLGLGDVKAMYAVGVAFGPLESLVAIFAACVSGIVTVAVAGRLHRGAQLHFGPHLAAGCAFALVTGAPIARHLSGA